MKITSKFLIIILVLFSVGTYAGPPCPTCPPGPPEVPINDNLVVLMIIALFFGIRVIYKYRLKTKASM